MNLRWWGCLAGLVSGVAAADPNDFQLYKLGCPSSATCGGLGVTGASGVANNDSYRVFAREIGAALASTNLMPPSSLGHAGFAFDADLSILMLNPSTTSHPNSFILPTTSDFSGPLLMPSVHIRKGLPWSFEAGARVAWIDKSRMGAGTIEAKWAVNEGFAYLPDVGIRGYGTRLFNNRDFDLTVAGLDFGIGKRFAIGGMITLTPYVGWNLVWVAASSNNIDFQPGRTQADAQATPTAQLNNTGVYDELGLGANAHNRFYGGVRFIGGVVQLIGEVSYSSLGSFTDSQSNKVQMPDLLTVNASIGLDF